MVCFTSHLTLFPAVLSYIFILRGEKRGGEERAEEVERRREEEVKGTRKGKEKRDANGRKEGRGKGKGEVSEGVRKMIGVGSKYWGY